jgi:hypothetical protein
MSTINVLAKCLTGHAPAFEAFGAVPRVVLYEYVASHIFGNAAPAGAPEEREGAVVGVEHHLLRLARVGAHEHHAAHAEPHVGDLHRRRHPADDDDLVAPVELVGFPRRKRQGNVGFRRRARVLLAPAPRIPANSVVAAPS